MQLEVLEIEKSLANINNYWIKVKFAGSEDRYTAFLLKEIKQEVKHGELSND